MKFKKFTLCNTRSLIYQVYGRQMKFGHFLGLLGWGSKEDQQILGCREEHFEVWKEKKVGTSLSIMARDRRAWLPRGPRRWVLIITDQTWTILLALPKQILTCFDIRTKNAFSASWGAVDVGTALTVTDRQLSSSQPLIITPRKSSAANGSLEPPSGSHSLLSFATWR